MLIDTKTKKCRIFTNPALFFLSSFSPKNKEKEVYD